MANPTDPATQINQALIDPASAGSDGQSVSSRSIGEQVLGLQFSALAAAVGNRRRGIRYSKMTTAPALSDASLIGNRAFSGSIWPG